MIFKSPKARVPSSYGLTATYDFTRALSSCDLCQFARRDNGAVARRPSGRLIRPFGEPSLFTALQSKLGLTLEKKDLSLE